MLRLSPLRLWLYLGLSKVDFAFRLGTRLVVIYP